eukprot:15437803-Alexandrium_andersonii.AAC.1
MNHEGGEADFGRSALWRSGLWQNGISTKRSGIWAKQTLLAKRYFGEAGFGEAVFWRGPWRS